MNQLIPLISVIVCAGCGTAQSQQPVVSVEAYCVDQTLNNPTTTTYVDSSCDAALARAQTHTHNFDGYCKLTSTSCTIPLSLLPSAVSLRY